MSCSIAHDGNVLRVTLSFLRDELLYDIKNLSFIESDILNDDSGHQKHLIADSGENGNVDRLTRIMSISISQCREFLYPFSKKEVTRTSYDDILREKNYVIELEVPDSFSQTTLHLLEKLIHEYIVCSCMSDWLSMTKPSSSEVWSQKADDAAMQIRSCASRRSSRNRIVPHWLS